MFTAADIMTENIVTACPEMTIQDAIEILLAKRISGLPVTDKEGHLVGVITEYALLAMAYDHDMQHETVGQHMTCNVISVEADAPIRRVVDLCILHRVRRIPVMRHGRLVGLISRRDVLRAMYEASRPACMV